ncbi:MAG: hypothetical protein OEV81_03655 [Betaproteobacteria bacterium]|nr:hypothetical protein [Betaproteobacteria bacterium]MDH5220582.1 hypothetical protein [Betaproteobacteria bacterium]MDH5352469.1 hypothetical protein [Betaproteobacteria bacterium]
MGDARPAVGSQRGVAPAAALVVLCLAAMWLGRHIEPHTAAAPAGLTGFAVAALAATYVAAMALPFVPGIEIGMALMLLLGGKGIALAINLPGNALIGGAGGIGLVAGMSGILSFPRYALTIAAATTPVPVLMLIGIPG